MRKTTEERFWAKVDKRGPGECWPWIGALTLGYGSFWYNNRLGRATRYALERQLGRPLAPGMHALHKPEVCHNPACVNELHLYEGTPADNARDRGIDGTENTGTKNGQSKLCPGYADKIRYAHFSRGASYGNLAAHYRVSSSAIQAACEGRTWV